MTGPTPALHLVMDTHQYRADPDRLGLVNPHDIVVFLGSGVHLLEEWREKLPNPLLVITPLKNTEAVTISYAELAELIRKCSKTISWF